MLGRRGKGTGAVSTAGQAVGVDRITPKSNWISKKVVPDVVVEPAATRYVESQLEKCRLPEYIQDTHLRVSSSC